ncbi:MAG TPA: fused MFS/spermidine synthase [Pyrinomonadaceae bacterium]
MAFIRRNILEVTVFVCGAVVMIYEIIGSRIVSPFIGTSTYVWTSLIGVILASLSIGYWMGGRFADKHPKVKYLGSAIFVAGGLISLNALVKDVVLATIASAPIGLEFQSILASVLLFGPASVALGFVLPYAVKLRLLSLEDSGKTVGRLYALSTVGSIVGTFAAGFLLIPFIGSVRTLYLIAASLILLALLLAPFAVSRTGFAVLMLFVLGVVSNESSAYYLWRVHELHDLDTEYSRIRVFRTTDPKTGRTMRALATDPYYVQSAIYLDGDGLALRYTPFYHLARHFRPGFQKTLMIGGAGYTIPQEYLRTYPGAVVDVVEIDPAMTDIAQRHFRLEADPRLNIIHEDGRVFLNEAASGQYDVVLMDAFGSLFTVPYQLTTIEAVRNIRRVLNENGIAILNVGGAIRGPYSKFFQAEFATYSAVFDRVLVFKVNPDSTDEQVQNLIIVACRSGCNDAAALDPEIAKMLSHRYLAVFPVTMPVLTDDHAPVEYYNSFAQRSRSR